MNKFLLAVAVCATFTIRNTAFAYDVHTHTAMTSEAVAQSKLTRDPKSSAIIKQLGIRPIPIPFGDRYIDIGSQSISRSGDDFEAKIMNVVRREDGRLALPEPYTLTGWLMRGAIREDDNSVETPDSDEPGGVFSRVYGHFFDPHNNRGLTYRGYTLGGRSADWALTAATTANGRENHYKIGDAREAMWRALTLTTLENGVLTTLPFSTNFPGFYSLGEKREDERKAYWATTFRALGDVVHLLQDTAQPQHTRNDAHSGVASICAILKNRTA